MPTRFELTDRDFEFNNTLDPDMALERMGFLARSIYREGSLIRVHCPIHKDLVRKSLIIDATEKTYKCQYASCPAYEGGLLIELIAMYFQCDLRDVPERLFSESRTTLDLVFRGEMLINQGRAKEALPFFEQACSASPRDEITRCKLAALYLELERKEQAYQEYLKAAESYAVRGELEKTLSIYNILIMLQPGAVKARKQLAFLFSRLGRPDAAIDQLKWVVDFYFQYGQMKGALEACEQLLEADPENATAHMLLGRLFLQASRQKEATHRFQEAARLFVEQHKRAEALEALQEALRLVPGSARLQGLQAQAEALPPDVKAAPAPEGQAAAAEEAFLSWIDDLEAKIDQEPQRPAAPPPPLPAPVPPAAPAPPPVAKPAPVTKPAPAAKPAPVTWPVPAAKPAPVAKPTPFSALPPVVGSRPTAPRTAPPPASLTPDPLSGRQETASSEYDVGLGAKAIALPASHESIPQPAPPSVPIQGPVVTPPFSVATPPHSVAPSPAPPQKAPARSPSDTSEIHPEDRRVALCLADLKNLPRDQVELMREQIIMMFNEVRRTYEEGLIAEWEMRSIKEFYKAFNMAVEQYLHGTPGGAPSSPQ